MANPVNVAELAVRITADGVGSTARDLGSIEKAGKSAATGIAAAATSGQKLGSAAKGTNETVQSLIYSFNGLAATTVGIPQSFGTIVSSLGPMLIGAPYVAALLAGITIIGRAWEAFGGKAKKAAEDAAEAAKKVKEELDNLQDEGDAKGLRKKARTLYEGTASQNFDNGITGLTRQIAEQQARYDAAVRQGNVFTFNAAKKALADLKAKLKPVQAEFDDIRRRLLAPGPSLDIEATPVKIEAEGKKAAKRAADAAARKARAADLAAQKELREAPREQAAKFGEVSNIGSRAGTNTEQLLAAALGATSAVNAETERNARGGVNMGALKGQIAGGLEFLGNKDELAKLAHTEELRANFADAIGSALGDGLAAGFETALSTGSIGAGFAALTGSLLGGLGGAMVAFGEKSLVASTLMETIKKSLASFLPGGGITASLAMIAIGSGLRAAASHAFGGSGRAAGLGSTGVTGGYSGGTASGGAADIIDRGVIAGALGGYGSPAIPTAAQTNGRALGTPVQPINVYGTFIGADDPAAQRGVVQIIRNAVNRGLTAPGFAPQPQGA